MPEILCPYCMSKITASAVQYICPRCGNPVLQKWWERLFGKTPVCKKPSCGKQAATGRRCPNADCGADLPGDILDYSKYLRFSILGISGSGKTNFLTVMLHEARKAGLPLVLTPMDRSTQEMFRQNEALIYGGTPAEPNPPGTAPLPQQWKVQDKSRMTNKSIPSYSLTVFDGAGEDHENIDPTISRYISGSRTLVILMDPLALPGVRRGVNKTVLDWSSNGGAAIDASTDLVGGIADYIRACENIKIGEMIDKDVAIVFSKLDAVFDSFGSCTTTQPSPHAARKAFVEADADAVDAEIRSWLEMQGEQGFIDAVEINFGKKNTRFFGVSSFGQPPTGSNRLGAIVPHRVLDPLMWVLAKEGIFPSVPR